MTFVCNDSSSQWPQPFTYLPVVGPGRDGLDPDGLVEVADEPLPVVVDVREDPLHVGGGLALRSVGRHLPVSPFGHLTSIQFHFSLHSCLDSFYTLRTLALSVLVV